MPPLPTAGTKTSAVPTDQKSARAKAIDLPRPLLLPVTSAVRPASVNGRGSWSSAGCGGRDEDARAAFFMVCEDVTSYRVAGPTATI